MASRERAATRAAHVDPARLTALEQSRRAFYARRFPEFWATVEGHPYALLDAHAIAERDVAALRSAARDAWTIFERVLPVMQALPDDELLALGIPSAALRIVRMPPPGAASTLARFDFALTAGAPRVLELNAETPFLLVESHRVAGAVARHVGGRDPNEDAERVLHGAIRRALANEPSDARIVVTAMNPYREDWFTAVYLAEQIHAATGRATDVVAVSELVIARDALVDAAGRRIDILWRLYPLEHFARDRDGARFCSLVERGRVRVVNPPAALLLQSKAAQAVIWGLHEARAWFTAEEHEIVRRLFLRSSMDAPEPGVAHVRKPVLGREGDSVTIVDGPGELLESERRSYAGQAVLHQELVELPRIPYVDPLRGERLGYGVHTAFVVDGEVSAIALRVGDRITNAWAHVLPLRVE